MADEPHVSESEWTRLWAHTLSSQDRRRISRAVKNGEVLEDSREALLAAELARRMRVGKRPAGWLVWANVGLAAGIATLLIFRWPEVRWLDILLLAVPLLNLGNIALSRRGRARLTALRQYEQQSLEVVRDPCDSQ